MTGLLWACPSEPPNKNEGTAPPKDAPASQPAGAAGGPASSSSKPADHPTTSSRTVDLDEVFRMPEFEGDVVLKVSGQPVSRAAYEHELRQMQIQLTATGLPPGIDRHRILVGAADRLVDQQILKLLAANLKVTPDAAYEKKWLEDLENRMESQPSFKSFLLRAGKDAAQRKVDAREAAIRQGIVDKLRVQVKSETEAEAKKYYESHVADFTERAGTQVWRLFLKAPRGMVQRDRDISRSRAEGLLAKAKKAPKNFTNLVISHSEGGKASTGGFVGWVSKGTLAPDLEKQLFAAKAGSILALWEDASGFFIYKVGLARKERVLSFDQVADQILNKIYRRTINDKINAELTRLKGEQTVEILVDALKKK